MKIANFRPLGVTAQTINALVKAQETDALALYMAYYEIADWQGTWRVRATTGFMAKRLGWSDSRVIKNKKILLRLNLIDDHKDVDSKTKQIKGHYVAIYHLVDTITPSPSHTCQTPGGGNQQPVENIGTSTLNVSQSTLNVNEGENSVSRSPLGDNNVTDSLSSPKYFTSSRNYEKIETLDDDGNPVEVSPRKPKKSWDAEFAVFRAFSEQCATNVGQRPLKPAAWQLKAIANALESFTPAQLEDHFVDWFATAKDHEILNIHSALSTHRLNELKMKL